MYGVFLSVSQSENAKNGKGRNGMERYEKGQVRPGKARKGQGR